MLVNKVGSYVVELSKSIDTNAVKLRGTHLAGKQKDLPTLIWLPELIEPAENFTTFFNREDNKIRDVRNVWCLNYRNQGSSDHSDSYDMEVSTRTLYLLGNEQ